MALADFGDLEAVDRRVDEATARWREALAARQGDPEALRGAEEDLIIAAGAYPWPIDEPVVICYSGRRPVRVGPSGQYAFFRPRLEYFERPGRTTSPSQMQHGPVVQVAQNVDGAWYPTPARYFTDTLIEGSSARLAIDYGQRWALDEADTAAFRQFARDVATVGCAG
ncbi:MAG: hypothetical protein EPN43_00065 [Jatrophihabitans sp.]|nr:MAG: hypothetical protein EPN43_00065 [Jatrophihabitans sp.]